MLKYLFFIVTIALVISCSKNGNGPDDNEAPVIENMLPLDNSTVTGGSVIPVSCSMKDNREIAEVHLHISNNSTGQLLIDVHRFPGAALYSLSENFTTSNNSTYKLQVIAVDRSANKTTKTVIISTN